MATRTQACSRPNYLMPISGAINTHFWPRIPGAPDISTASIHFQNLRTTFEDEGSWETRKPRVIPLLGLRPITRTYPVIRDSILRKLDQHPDQRTVILGHSLGGLTVARFVFENMDDPRLAGGITVDSPHLGLFGGPLKHIASPAMSQLIDRGGCFTEATAELAKNASEAGKHPLLTMIATSTDFVTPAGALPPFAGAKRILLATELDNTPQDWELDGVDIRTGPKLGHVAVLVHGTANDLILQEAMNIVNFMPPTMLLDVG